MKDEVRRGDWITKPHWVPLARDASPLSYEDGGYDEETHSEKEYWWHCNNCDYEASRDMKPSYRFCPNCGADMKGV